MVVWWDVVKCSVVSMLIVFRNAVVIGRGALLCEWG